MTSPTRPSRETRDAERDEASEPAAAGREPTEEEERLAEENSPDPSVSEHEADMLQRGVEQEGEGRIP